MEYSVDPSNSRGNPFDSGRSGSSYSSRTHLNLKVLDFVKFGGASPAIEHAERGADVRRVGRLVHDYHRGVTAEGRASNISKPFTTADGMILLTPSRVLVVHCIGRCGRQGIQGWICDLYILVLYGEVTLVVDVRMRPVANAKGRVSLGRPGFDGRFHRRCSKAREGRRTGSTRSVLPCSVGRVVCAGG